MGKAYYDTNAIEVKHYTLQNSPLGEVLAGLKIAHLSDLHIRKVGLRENKVLEILNKEKPDLIFLTGDYIHFDGPYAPVMDYLNKIKAPLGVYCTMGNTEYYNENGSCVLCHQGNSKAFKNGNPIVIRNSARSLKIKGKTLIIAGVDDPVSKRSNLTAALKEVTGEHPTILLSHSPEIFEEAATKGVDLVLSGHTHGGQVLGVGFLQKLFPLEPSMDMLKGLFQKGRTLMNVSKGVGTSFLPFRIGIKPEVTFFQFPGKDREEAEDQAISNKPPETVFAGISVSNFLNTFNVFPLVLHKVFPINLNTRTDQTDRPDHQNILFDFESPEELQQLNWECHKWFELTKNHGTSGNRSLRVSLPPGQYPGINFRNFRRDWSPYKEFKMDVFNPVKEKIAFHIRIDDQNSGWEYADRFDKNFILGQGMNPLSIPLNTIKTNLYHRPMNLKKIERMMVFIPGSQKKRELYIDNIRLE